MFFKKIPPIKLFPGGQSIGISFQAEGVTVLKLIPVRGVLGKSDFPAKAAKISVGDAILEIDGKKVNTQKEVQDLLDLAGQQKGYANILLKSKNKFKQTILEPTFCQEEKKYLGGLYLLSHMSGIGTMTFIEPSLKKYGAVGHYIPTFKNNKMKEWAIMASKVTRIEKAENGLVGTKFGTDRVECSDCRGSIERNTPYGIFGRVRNYLPNTYFEEPIPIGDFDEIKKGPAKIYTVIDGEKVEEFSVNLIPVSTTWENACDIQIVVTDPSLIQKTGGIVKGMSGSPIIQNERFVGAVSYISGRDSLQGYGVYIGKMVANLDMEESEFLPHRIKRFFNIPIFN